MARKKKKGSKGGKGKGRPALASFGRAKKGSLRGRKTMPGKAGSRQARKVTKSAKTRKRTYR